MHRVLKYVGKVNSDQVVIIPDVDSFINENSSDDVDEIIEEIIPQELAEFEAQNIINDAKQRCKDILKQAEDQADGIRAQARQQAYDDAFQLQLNDIVNCLNQTRQTLTDIQKTHDDYINQYASKLNQFSLEIASSIIKRKLEVDPLIMCDLVENVMSSIKDAKWAVVTLSKELVPLIELLQSELPARCPTVVNLEIEGKDIPVGRCIIDSPIGLIDASIDEQLKNLTRRFEQVQQKRGKM
ncbi:MAG: FliH/SctL family protein [Oscillospiraceae bacterium]